MISAQEAMEYVTEALYDNSPDTGGYFKLDHYPNNPHGPKWIASIDVEDRNLMGRGESAQEAISDMITRHPELFGKVN